MNINTGSMRHAGFYSRNWSSTGDPAMFYVQFFHLGDEEVYPSFSGDRWSGFAVGNCFKQPLTLPNPKSHKFYREKIVLNLFRRNKLGLGHGIYRRLDEL